MPDCYVKMLVDGYEESINVNWLTSVVITSTHPGNERGTAVLADGETKGVLIKENFLIAQKKRPEIFTSSKFGKLCESLGEEADPFENDKKTMEEWWEELRNT